MERQRHVIRSDLAGRVRRLALQRMLLRDRNEACRTVHLAGGRMNHLCDTQITCGLQDVERSLDVGVDVSIRGMIRVGNADESRQMQHRVAALHGGAHPIRISNVAREHLETAPYVRAAMVQPSPGIERVVQNEGTDIMTRAHQRLGQMRSDEPIGTRDQCLLQTTVLTIFRKLGLDASSWSYVPWDTTRPRSISTITSHLRTVVSRCAIRKIASSRSSAPMASITDCSVALSRALVASSKTRTLASLYKARAIPIRWR